MSLTVDIRKEFRDFSLRVTFTTDRGTMGILGASGAGKSLTLRCIAGIDHPDVLLADDGEMTITGGGVRIVRAATGIITFRRDAPGA